MTISTAIIFAVVAIGVLALIFGLVLGYASIRFKVEGDPLVEQIDAVLPQTQCGQCGYPGCKPYAEAIAEGDDINKCPPGGEATIKKLADLMGVEPKPLDAAHGEEDVKKSGVYTRRRMYRLYQMYSGLPCRRHFRCRQTHAHGYY